MKKDILINSLCATIGRGLGFFIPFFIAAVFGISAHTDAFFLAFSIILLIQMVVGNVFETAIVPFIAAHRLRAGRLDDWLGGVLAWTTVFSAALTILTVLSAKPILISTTSLDPATQYLAFVLLLEMLPMIFLMTWSSTLSGALNACKVFSVPALSPGFRSVAVFGCIWILKTPLGIHALPVGYVAGEILRLVISEWAYRRRIGSPKWQWKLDPEAKRFFQSASWQAVALSVLCSLSLVNQVMASYAGTGDLSLFAYGERLRNVPFLIFFTGVLPVVYSHWANDALGAWSHHRRTLLQFAALAFGASAVMVAFKDPLTVLAYGRGAFPKEALHPASIVFAWLSGGFVFDVIGLLCVRLLILHRQDKIYMTLAVGRVLGTALVNAVLLPHYGIYGIAASVTLVNGFYALVLYLWARRFGPSPLSSERIEPCCSTE